MTTLPAPIKKSLRATKKSVRNYEVVACIHAGRTVAISVAVIEDGHATYTTGTLTWAQLRHHYSKFDAVLGTWQREYEQLRTETLLEEMQKSGVEIPAEPFRYYEPHLSLNRTRRHMTVENTLTDYLKSQGFSRAKANVDLSIRHLERMRHRTGYIVPRRKETYGDTDA